MEEQYRGYWGVIPGEVMHDKELPHAGKLLYLVLSSMAGKHGYCWPANETLAAELDLSKRRVRELLAMLQERGFADRRKAGWRCLYQEHLCGMKHRLCDYVPEGAEEITLELFGFSQVLV